MFLEGSHADEPFLLRQSAAGDFTDVAPSGFGYPSNICGLLPCCGVTGALHPIANSSGQAIICAPSTKSAVCARAGQKGPANFEFLSLDPADDVYTPFFDSDPERLPPSPFYYIRVYGTLYFMATSKESDIFLGGVVPSADETALHQHFFTELLSQSQDLSDVSIGPVSTTGNGVLLTLSLGTTLHLVPFSSDFHMTKEDLTMGDGLQSLDWSSPSSGGSAALGRTCRSAWRLVPDETSNTILVICKNRLQQLKVSCSGPHFTRCSFRNELHNASSKFTSAPVEILHDANNTAVCYITQNPKGWLSKTMSAFPSPLEGLTNAPLVDEDTDKMLRAKGPLCSPPDGQGSTAFFINEDGELYKLVMVDGALKCKNLKLGTKCASCHITACQRDPETLALSDESTELIKIFDPGTNQVHHTSIPAASKLSLFGWRTENPVVPTIPPTIPGTNNRVSKSDSHSNQLGLKVGLPIGLLFVFIIIGIGGLGAVIVIAIFLKKHRSTSEPTPVPPIDCTDKNKVGSPLIGTRL